MFLYNAEVRYALQLRHLSSKNQRIRNSKVPYCIVSAYLHFSFLEFTALLLVTDYNIKTNV